MRRTTQGIEAVAQQRAVAYLRSMDKTLHIIGGGMAGSEAAWQAAHLGLDVVIHEMRPKVGTFAHQTGLLGEMVCSNSFRSDDSEQNAVGLLHWEMRAANGLIMQTAQKHRLPAGGALAVDRDPFAQSVTDALLALPNVRVDYEEITELPRDGHWIIATGPLTSTALGASIAAETGADALAFFDAIAPIVYFDSIDMSKAWMQSRYDKGETEEERTAYLNCPMDKAQYEAFIDALDTAEKTEFHEGETAGYFDGCLPIEVMAERGRETLRFGPMKPVGLTNPHQPDVKPYAIVQLRRDNKLGTLYNIVGFQTKMKYGAQTDVFKRIPGLENASFARLGGIHRNTFLNSPTLLDGQMRLRSQPHIRHCAVDATCDNRDRCVDHAYLGRSGGENLSADEREFRAFPSRRRAEKRSAGAQGPLQGLYRSCQGRLAGLAHGLTLDSRACGFTLYHHE